MNEYSPFRLEGDKCNGKTKNRSKGIGLLKGRYITVLSRMVQVEEKNGVRCASTLLYSGCGNILLN